MHKKNKSNLYTPYSIHVYALLLEYLHRTNGYYLCHKCDFLSYLKEKELIRISFIWLISFMYFGPK